ncbi:MAG: hypothetical protein ACF8PG_01030 [Maioricimonas sp. JB045]|uniref:hypothetical protein n=1 Tax=Maioricimonas sp. JC845 TaxID=3232138 RepID=UPI0034593516
MSEGKSVLVVDGPQETARVIEAILGPRGVDVSRVRRETAKPAADSQTSNRPNLIVCHVDDEDDNNVEDLPGVPRVVIGTLQPSNSQNGRFLQSPFEYGELLRAVEELLELKAS